ncbi:hypothetical protein BT96DRAFT_571254 [Gymnopus androsaceus JB14]|uniref:F-box domain-containing protein n=1 Tax=Gymnopus androsaceus JB14 TaxID=1447944 RepID=A0A6A4HYQ1_9AGAR|nr:hypothetical protein BT96DRAFT_571254 [Gymnopus androsaceus JB14]
MLRNICNPSLTCLILDLSLRDKAPPLEPRYVSEIIQQIGDDCPGLTDFGIGFPNPEQQHSVELITSALNSIRFPNLKYLDLGYDGDPNSPSGLALDWNQFLLNHPTVEDLQYRHSRALPDCLPRLKAFKGAFDCRDVLSLGAYRLLSALELEVYQPWDINDVVNFRLTLQEMPLLQTLVLKRG